LADGPEGHAVEEVVADDEGVKEDGGEVGEEGEKEEVGEEGVGSAQEGEEGVMGGENCGEVERAEHDDGVAAGGEHGPADDGEGNHEGVEKFFGIGGNALLTGGHGGREWGEGGEESGGEAYDREQ
jgi:hypothetical protein